MAVAARGEPPNPGTSRAPLQRSPATSPTSSHGAAGPRGGRGLHVRARATHPAPGGAPLPPQREPAPQQRRQVPEARPQRRGGRLALRLPGARAAAQGAVGRGCRGQGWALARRLHLDGAHRHSDALTVAAAPAAALLRARLRAFTRQREGATAARARDALPAAAHWRAPGPEPRPRALPRPRPGAPRPAPPLTSGRVRPSHRPRLGPWSASCSGLHRCAIPRNLLLAPSPETKKSLCSSQEWPGVLSRRLRGPPPSRAILAPQHSPYPRNCSEWASWDFIAHSVAL